MVAMVVTDADGDVLEEQPTSVEEGTSIFVAVMPVNEDGDAMMPPERSSRSC